MRLDQPGIELVKPFPSDLDALYCWIDVAMWSRLVNPDRLRTSETRPVLLPTGEPIVESHPNDLPASLIRIYPPADLRVATIEAAAAESVFFREFVDSFPMHQRPQSWLSTRVIIFGDTPFGEPLAYCIDAPEGHRSGCIITFIQGQGDRIWLADSLGEWLARLAACDGVEYAFAPGDIGRTPLPLRTQYKEEFSARNAHSSLFGDK